MDSAQILVVSRYDHGLDGDPALMAPERRSDIVLRPLLPWRQAIERTYSFQAGFTVYSMAGVAEMPKLRKPGLTWLDKQYPDQPLMARWAFIDVDLPGHREWQSGEVYQVLQRIRQTPLTRTAGFYQTEHGYRLFWPLPNPIHIRFFESFLIQLIVDLRACGIEADTACSDWTRVFNAPRCTKDAAKGPLNLLIDVDCMAPLAWSPRSPLTESRSVVIDEASLATWPASPPDAILAPRREEFDFLKGYPDLYKRLVAGKPLGEPGSRNTSMVRAVGIVASEMLNQGAVDPVQVYRLLATSILADQSHTSNNGKAPTLNDLWGRCRVFCAQELGKKKERDTIIATLSAHLSSTKPQGQTPNTSPPLPYTPPAPEPVPGLMPAPADTSRTPTPPPVKPNVVAHVAVPITKQVVLAHGDKDAFFVLDERSGTYCGPYGKTHLPSALLRLAPTIVGDLRSGTGALLSVPEILVRHGTEILRHRAVIGQHRSFWNARTQSLSEGVAAIRTDVEPKYHDDINKWLTLLGGDYSDKLFDWLATFCDLSAPTCGLYIMGNPGYGKGMLAEGLAKLWDATPVKYKDVVEAFNGGLQQTALVWADETIPVQRNGQTPSAIFRELVGNSAHTLNRKFLPPVPLTGCLRLLITANNLHALRIHEDLSNEDYRAIVDRIGFIRAPDATQQYLEDLGGRAHTVQWVEGLGIAEHVLWLAANRKVKRGSRFLVKGWESEVHRHLQVNSGLVGMVLEVVANAVSSDSKAAGVWWGDGKIVASVQGIQSQWQNVHGAMRDAPNKARILAALRQISLDGTSIPINTYANDKVARAERVQAWPIRVEDVLRLVEAYQYADLESVVERINDPPARWIERSSAA